MSKNVDAWLSHAMADLGREISSDSEAITILVDLVFVATVLDEESLSRWWAGMDAADGASALVTELQACGIELQDARAIVAHIDNLAPRTQRRVVAQVQELVLPNHELAMALEARFVAEGRGELGLSSELVELCLSLAQHNTATKSLLCAGANVLGVVLAASQHQHVTYQLLGVGVGRSFKKHLLQIAGADVAFPDLSMPAAFQQGLAGAPFAGAVVADSWGLRRHRNQKDPGQLLSEYPSVASEVRALPHIVDSVKGRIVCIVPQSWLTKTSGADEEYKNNLIADGFMEAVIQLPGRFLKGASNAPALLVLQTKGFCDRVQFIDAAGIAAGGMASDAGNASISSVLEMALGADDESEFWVYRHINDILDARCNLDVNRYVLDGMQQRALQIVASFENTQPLSELASMIRCQAIKTVDPGKIDPNSIDIVRYPEVAPAQITHVGTLEASKQPRDVCPDEDGMRVAKRQLLRAGDIVFVIKGAVGKCALVPVELQGAIGNQSFVIIRLKDHSVIEPVVLLRYLMSPLVKNMAAQWTTGAAVPMIKMRDLEQLPVPILSSSQRERVLVNQQKVERLANELQDIQVALDEALSELWALDEA